MDNLRERLDELELRVKSLEHELQSLKDEKMNNKTDIKFDSILINNKVIKEENKIDRKIKNIPKNAKSSSFFDNIKSNESLIGKYFIGALASILIFIAAISFIAIVWNKISPEIKLLTVSGLGIILTACGFNMTLKKASNISSILFGTGIGLVYISIVSSSLVFEILGHQVSTILCIIWTIIILLSHRYTKLYFTIIIACIGNFINLSFELGYVIYNSDIFFIIIYTTIISALLFYTSINLDKLRNSISIIFVFFNFSWIYLWINDSYTPFPMAGVITVVILILITNWMYRLANIKNISYTYLILTSLSTLFLYSITQNNNVKLLFNFNESELSIIFVILIVFQFLVNIKFYKNIEKYLNLFYLLPMYFGLAEVNSNFFNLYLMGAAPILFLLVLRKRIWRLSIPVSYIFLFIILDLPLTVIQDNKWSSIFIIFNLILMFYILSIENVKSDGYKNLAIGILLFSYYKLSHQIFRITGMYYYFEIADLIAYLLCVSTIIYLYFFEYFNIKTVNINGEKKNRGLYIFTIVLYFIGITEMNTSSLVLFRFIIMLGTLVIILFQSKLLLSDYKEIPNFIGIWLVLKYFIFIWLVMSAFLEINFDSVAYSVVGLLTSVVAIYVGFKIRVLIIRKFGLLITMIMVGKFIFVDLQGENSITRVIAFTLGGILCFVISIIYNRLSKD